MKTFKELREGIEAQTSMRSTAKTFQQQGWKAKLSAAQSVVRKDKATSQTSKRIHNDQPGLGKEHKYDTNPSGKITGNRITRIKGSGVRIPGTNKVAAPAVDVRPSTFSSYVTRPDRHHIQPKPLVSPAISGKPKR